ncbi:ArsR family transcriptional regulator [Deinococcus metallilatus]|uniref:ArsR family transcriptional regulator n=1 Tax=Deinococcus metallilatus TaxID=1211322 RepID=A0AAJ5JX12_9DEIO|nr:ArsR family transcriptional regulator [Deinococcus metallilatus]MBB5297335.1 putative ArsR family transcriptional regulator [Deinococcus metallilatus]QBY10112.1 ArsR family transcriptional regulator [Deinococcus metallilatus]RXJ08272.1 ArsR family transcriptional regulator [Deinococcus metallilatus]TLK21179.1 ArsR family transcriptional regulator [Deinococcus metallilatus]
MPVVSPALDQLPATRRAILCQLKKRGEAGADDLAQTLGITASGIRQHLGALEQAGFLMAQDHREGPGRPRRRYRLTAQADALFPRAYAELTNELLTYVQDEDPALVARLFEKRAERRLHGTLARTRGLPFREQVRELARILDEDGYLADMQENDDGSFTVTEHNCAVLSVALQYGHACGSELGYIKAALPTAEVTRIAHMLSGAHVCAYRIRPRGEETPEGA